MKKTKKSLANLINIVSKFSALAIFSVLMICSAAATSASAQNVTVNPGGGSYATLKAAFDAINSGTHTGAVTISIDADTTETATAVLNASGSGAASYTSILITPNGVRTVSGAGAAGSALIEFNGADNVTIDGGVGNNLTISNTTVSGTSGTSTIRFVGDATGNTVTRTNVLGSANMAGGTNGGNIFFSTAASGGSGNDNNTISNCNLGPAGTNLPTKLIYSSGSTTSTATANSNITITGNNLYDFFSATVAFRAMDINGGSTDWTISNNRLFQTATRTFTSTTATTSAGIYVANTSTTSLGNNFQVTGNTIGFADAAGNGVFTITATTGAIRFRAIHLQVNTSTAPIVASTISGNTVAGISFTTGTTGTTTSAAFIGIYPQTGLINTTNNTVGSQSATGSIIVSSTATGTNDVYGIFNFASANAVISNNNIGGISAANSSTGSTSIVGIRCDLISTVSCIIQNNQVGGTVANSLSSTSTGTSTRVYGIEIATGGTLVTGNTVRNLTNSAGNTGTTSSASIIGIAQASGSSSATITHNVSENVIHTLSNTHPTAAVSVIGITHSGATTSAGANVVGRNFIHSLAIATSGAGVLTGINVSSGVTTYKNNMVRVGIDAAGNSVTGAYTVNGINESSGTNNYYHNSVYVGGSSGTSTLNTFAFSSSVTVNARNFNNNIFANNRTIGGGTGGNFAAQYGGTLPNPSGLNSNFNVYYSSDSATLIRNGGTAYTLAAWKSASGNQDANSILAALAQINFVNANGTAATVDLHVQSPTIIEGAGTGIASVTDDFDGQIRANFSPVDIGADAGNFVAVDVSGPGIGYTALTQTALTTNRTLNVTITDATGVAGGGLAPRIYFQKNGGGYVSTPCTMTGGTPQNGTYACLIDYSLVGGVTGGDVIQYFVIAQDTLGNVSANPGGGVVATDVNTVTTAPTTPNSYTVVAPFPTSVNVGTGETYTSLTNAGGVFAALNAGVLTGNVTINLTSDLTAEGGTIALNQLAEDGVGGYTVTIKPSGAPRAITGTASAATVIKLNGADRVVIDGSLSGGTDQSLTIVNPNTASGTTAIWIGSVGAGAGATNNTIKNTVIRAGTRGTGSAAGTVVTTFAIFVGNTSGAANGPDNDNLTIQNNLIQRATYGIQALGDTGALNDNTLIEGNTFGDAATDANTIGRIGMLLGQSSNAMVRANKIQNVLVADSGNSSGLILSTGFVNSTVTGNNISNIRYTGTGGYGGKGIDISTGTLTSGVTISNNFVSDIKGDGWNALTSDSIVGLRILSGSGGFNIWNNSVNLGSGNFAGNTSGTLSAAFYVGATSGNLDVRNNIFANNLNNTAVTTDKNYAVNIAAANTVFTNINYNDYYVPASTATGPQVLGFLGSDRLTLADIQTATAQDVNSLANNPAFASNSELHLQSISSLLGAGTPTAVTNDIDGEARNATPDIGADEVTRVAAGNYNNLTLNSGLLTGNVTVNGILTLNGGGVGGGANTLTLGCNATIVGAGSGAYIDGRVTKQFCSLPPAVPETFVYPVGENGYSPVTANVTAVGISPSALTVDAVDAVMPNMGADKSISRYWDITETGDVTADLAFTYIDADVPGTANESDFRVWKRDNGQVSVQCPLGPCVNTATNTVNVTGVTSFSQWTAAELGVTAAQVTLAGRVTTADGRGVRNARITLIEQDGTQRTVLTGQFGVFRFTDVNVGQTVTIEAFAKRFVFAEPTRVMFVSEETKGLDFTALDQQ